MQSIKWFITLKGMSGSKEIGIAWRACCVFSLIVSYISEYIDKQYNIVIESSLEGADCLGSDPHLATS